MARSTQRSNRKASGGRYHHARTKRKFELAEFPTHTRLTKERKIRKKRTMGGNTKISLLTANQINVTDKQGKTTKMEILNVIENQANPNLVRRNVLVKGAIVETKLGKAKITSRPGQEGTVNGILV